ncbi:MULTISPECIES: lipopolysaccharide assembly protein LapB [unclassified Treponema]|uniref:tetratricopeptide repeat protein n=1 Tax=unclassified Treponema TaxID=2638727 RepID=UPI0020A613FB|nr:MULTISPECIES: tetratricopeptide repeat protein [unclassified Treponema]UTC66205.1 tetratricopeptide repeat protein [Treponema sp. OMZ 789]UTC68934.1 tetratricopeptide repeat protein [Treponema sp. OMZ 790]UTC71662.1 tetratricopeptide repeat protein [Treponema sp. OMZ 791]
MKITRQIFICFSFLIVFPLFFSCTTSKKTAEEPVIEKPKKTVKKAKKTPREEFKDKLTKLLNKQDFEGILKLIDESDPELTKDFKIQHIKLSILISMRKTKEAESFAEELAKTHPNNTDILYAQAMLAQSRNDFKKKEQYLKKILAINPKNAQALTEQGLDFYSAKRYNDARRKFIDAYKADPKCTDALIGLGRINYLENKLEQAEKNLTAVLEQDPNNTTALAELARIKSETNRMYQALKDINKAAELEPNNPSHWNDLGSYNLTIGRKEEAKKAYSKVIELTPDSYIAYIYRAGINDELGYKEEALNDYIKVCNLYPPYYFALEGAGILFWEKEDWENAGTAFLKALNKAPASYQYALLYATALYKQNKKPDAKKFMQNYIKTINRTEKENEYFLCRLFIDLTGDSELINRASIETDLVKKGRMFFYLGEFYTLNKKDALAEKCYVQVLSIENPAFFEYRFAKKAMDQFNSKSGK